MLGHRGCRLGITFPEIYGMQVRAIMEAACEVGRAGRARGARDHDPAHRHGRRDEADLRDDAARGRRVIAEMGVPVRYLGGTMIEVPAGGADRPEDGGVRRILLVRDQRPHPADVRLQPGRRRRSSCRATSRWGSCRLDPFSVLDQEGVGELIALGIDRGRRRAATSRWASAASTAARPRRWSSATRWGWTTCRARRSWSPSPGWPPPRPGSKSREKAKRAA